ncbi:MAG: transcription-repair coupling factor [Chloroflexota bacterium]|nr:transcription-repair coupling factor [Chloroflexota bacterium]
MSLSGLLPLLYDQRGYGAIARGVASGENVWAEAPMDAARPYLLAALHADVTAQSSRPLIVVAPRSERARQLYEGLLAYSPPGTPILFFPAPDLLPYERIAPDPTIIGERLRVIAMLQQPELRAQGAGGDGQASGSVAAALHELVQNRATGTQLQAPIIVTSVFALMTPTLSPADLQHAIRVIRRGERVVMSDLLSHLVGLGYEPAAIVEEPGQFGRRGGIVDLFPPTSNLPIRVEFFGDEIDSIRQFNPLTQRSEGQANALVITPSCELPLWKHERAYEQLRDIDASNLREEVLEEWRDQLEKTGRGECFEGQELFSPFYTRPLASLADYLAALRPTGDSKPPLLVLDDPELIRLEASEIERQASELYQGFIDNGELPPGLERPYLSWEEVAAHGQGLPTLSIGGGAEGAIEAPPFTGTRLYTGNVPNVIADLREYIANRTRVVIVSQQSSRLRELLEDEGVYPTLRKGKRPDELHAVPGNRNIVGVEPAALSQGAGGLNEALTSPPSPGTVNLLQGALAAGWQLMQGTHTDTLLLTDMEIFGRSQTGVRRATGQTRRSTSDAAAILREKMLLELKPSDYVVHVEHGIAKFGGLVHMTAGGADREYMLLLYAEGDRLYVPADQTDRVAPYIGAGPPPALHRLGTAEWSRTKRKVREAAELLARDLLELYANREAAGGFAYSPDTTWQYELEESFPFVETPDQLRSIAEVKTDMEEPRPMDRLICGDVGYGKTEVALRAAFKAVMDGRQVAVLVPTTVLAQQHFNTFSERLAAFPVTVSMISRFRSRQEQTKIVKDLAEGKIDIIIGTHMLLSKSIQFKNLGMVVVDEEQRFGVRHKERLKQLRAEVDVLTLSATPIPRTLYMAISGVRDLSLIETPPEARLPIKTYVTAFRPQLVREVILRELERGGQVFLVHNRVETIDKLAYEMEALVPEARFIVGHGQMQEDMLEKVMQKFVAREADVLICTTIIESGLDIPNANTLIVDHADKLGLAQLYQLRGRVGRGANRAYAYFLYHSGRKVTVTARERLSTIEQATELGSGFRIALRDLEIRGAGNLLGPEQSGHVAAVGLDLYTRLLASAVDRVRSERKRAQRTGTTDDGAVATATTPQVATASSKADTAEPPTVSIDLPITAFLPDDYVPDAAVRLRLYQRLAASMTPAQVRDFGKELQDRFGTLPEPAANLLEVVRLKGLAITAGVESIRALAEEYLIVVPEDSPIREHVRMRLQRKHKDLLKTSPHQVRINRARAGEKWQATVAEVLEEMGEAEG